jgi:hypothetical protein
MFQDNIITCFKDEIVLFITLATYNRLFILEDNIAFNATKHATNYKDYS